MGTRVQVVETGEIVDVQSWFNRHPNVNFGQPLTDAVLLEAHQTWPDTIMLARIFVPTLEWARGVATNAAHRWEEGTIQWSSTTFEWNGITWNCATDTETYFLSWNAWDIEVNGPWPEWFGWQDVNWVEHLMTQAEYLAFAAKHAEVLEELLAPIRARKLQMLAWVQSCTDIQTLEDFSGYYWQP